jgi:hypothetical protein
LVDPKFTENPPLILAGDINSYAIRILRPHFALDSGKFEAFGQPKFDPVRMSA